MTLPTTAAYIAEILRGAIQSVPQRRVRSITRIGHVKRQSLQLHSSCRARFASVLPRYGNEVISDAQGQRGDLHRYPYGCEWAWFSYINSRTISYEECSSLLAGLIYLRDTLLASLSCSKLVSAG